MRAGSQPVDADRLGIPLDWHRSASGERNGLTGQSRRDVSLLQRSCSPDAGVGGDTGCGLKAATAMTAKHDIVAFPGDLEIRAALARVVASVCLRGSPRLISFLCFVVEATLTGQADRLKGYCIAVGALGRSDNFDPQTNPIVRVEAARLRRALERYYAGMGRHDQIVIELPRGRYVPTFSRRGIGHSLQALAAYRRQLIPGIVQQRLRVVAFVACIAAGVSVVFNLAFVLAQRTVAPGACLQATSSESVEVGRGRSRSNYRSSVLRQNHTDPRAQCSQAP